MFPTRLIWHAAATEPRYMLSQMLAPTAIAIEEEANKLSPAPEESIGAVLKAGNWSVTHVSLFVDVVLATKPSDPRVMIIFLAHAFLRSFSAITINPE